ncbi:MAG: glycosyltransferase [Alteromonadaceae bacterium]|nr:glycosyltransferase [Alteromonadaceae bacterium]
MKIGIDARSVCMLQRGMPVYAWNLLIRLPQQLPACEFYFFINTQFEHNLPKEEYQAKLELLCTHNNVNIIDIKDDAYMYWEQWLLYKACKTYQIDLLHMPANRICLLYANKQIVTLHDTIEWDNLSLGDVLKVDKNIKHILYAMRTYLYTLVQYTVGVRLVKKIVTISKYAQSMIFNTLSINPCDLNYIYHGIPDAFRKVECIPLEQRRGVLMLGGASPHKNPYNTLKSYAQLPSTVKEQNPLSIIGIAPQSLSQFDAWISELSIKEYVSLQSWVDETELVKAFQYSKVFLFASKEEGFGFPQIQAMSTGTPVLISTCPVLMEISEGLMPCAEWNDTQGLSIHLSEMLTNKSHLQALSKLALELSTKFTWEHSVSQVVDIYQEVLEPNVSS